MSQKVKQKSGPDVDGIVEKHGRDRRKILTVLHEIQSQTVGNYLRKDDLRKLAKLVDIPYSDLHGVVTFYSMFSTQPRGQYVIRVCESGPCALMGAETVFDVLEKELEVELYQTSEDGLFTLEPSSCLGVCGVAPAMMINEETYGNLSPGKIKDILAEYRQKDGVKR